MLKELKVPAGPLMGALLRKAKDEWIETRSSTTRTDCQFECDHLSVSVAHTDAVLILVGARFTMDLDVLKVRAVALVAELQASPHMPSASSHFAVPKKKPT